MATQHEIILIDGGDDVGPMMPRPQASDTPAVAPRPDAGTATSGTRPARGGDDSPAKKAKDKETAASAAGELAGVLGRVLGAGNQVAMVEQMSKAYSGITGGLEKLSKRMNEGPTNESESGLVLPDWLPGKPAANVNIKPVGPAPGGATAAQGMQALAGRASGVAAEASGGLAGLARAAGAAGPVIAGFTVAVGAGALATKTLFDTLANESKRLEGVSAEISVASSMNDVRRELADIKRAERIGPDLARFESTRGKLSEKWGEVWTEILAVLAKFANAAEPFIEFAANTLGVIASGMEVGNAHLEIVSDFFSGRLAEIWDDVKAKNAAQEKFNKSLEKLLLHQQDQEDDLEDPFMKLFLAQFMNAPVQL